MNKILNAVRKEAGKVFIGMAVLAWSFGTVQKSTAQHDNHAGHDHAEHAEEAEHDGHEGHGDEEGGALKLTAEQREHFGIVIKKAGPGSLKSEASLPGEIVFNADNVVHMVPRVSGIAREVRKSVGDRVTAGETVAVIDSRELADAKSEYLAAHARLGLAQKIFVREKALRDKQVSSEQDYLEAEQALAETQIELRSSEQKLHALGLTEKELSRLDSEHDESITRYEIKSPITGIVTEKHISIGESLSDRSDIFTVADMSSVWVNLTVYMKNIGAIHAGQPVTLRIDHSGIETKAEIEMVTPFIEESTRSATARVVLDNSGGHWIPGTFVTGFSSTSEANLPLVVAKSSVQNIEGRDVVFIEDEDGFEMKPVTKGKSDRHNVEIIAGLEAGTDYVAEGAFRLKATIVTSSLGGHAGHGH